MTSDFPIQELEWRLIYSVIVAGKSAKFADNAMANLMQRRVEGETPLGMVRRLRDIGQIWITIRIAKTGNYTKLEQCLCELVDADIDLAACAPEQLETIHGIGPKTSRFFIIWTRPEERYAALDVHVLRWMRERGHKAPRSTPNGKQYRELEITFIAEADKMGMTPRELDFQIWEKGSGYTGEIQAA